jgi:hypothetical protein
MDIERNFAKNVGVGDYAVDLEGNLFASDRMIEVEYHAWVDVTSDAAPWSL